jgi:Tol biopolymer transport system component
MRMVKVTLLSGGVTLLVALTGCTSSKANDAAAGASATSTPALAGSSAPSSTVPPTPLVSPSSSATAASERSLSRATKDGPPLKGRLAFQRSTNGSTGPLFTSDTDGRNEKQLTKATPKTSDAGVDWSPDGKRLLFSRYVVDGTGEEVSKQIFTIGADGSGLRALAADHDASYAPNGRLIAYQHADGKVANNTIQHSHIFIMDADGRHPRQVTAFPDYSGDTGGARWSPDGRRLLFTRIRSNPPGAAAYTINIDGTGLKQLTPWSLGALGGDWSKSANLIVLPVHDDTGKGNFFTVRPDGTGLTQVTHFTDTWISNQVRFSPDGQWFVFTANDGAGSATRFISSVDGKQLRRMNTKDLVQAVVENSVAWTP